MSMEKQVLNSRPVNICLMEKHWKFLLNTKIAYDLRVYHDLDPRLKDKFMVTGKKGA